MKVIVGISGGVDSSVAALLLMQQGYDVEGLFMKNWEEDDDAEYCAAEVDLRDAKAVCEKLGITLHAINFASEYWDNVFEHFLDEYKAGRTPNPDILCNTEIKFKAFLEHALDRGADFIATGHYVAKDEVKHDDGSSEYRLREAQDQNKDQTYFLHGLNQHQLKHSLFPLGDISKPEVRQIAEKHGLVTADKKDSTGICFIGERKFSDFLAQYLPAQPGNIETLDGEVIGRHNGLMYYTIGQRQGLGIGGLKHHPEEPWFSVEKDLARNVLIATQGHDHPSLLKQTLTLQSIHWIAGAAPISQQGLLAKIRYRQTSQACHVSGSEGEYTVHFEQAQRAITPGQYVVFYQQGSCLGGGVIVAGE